ncbi:MAG: hypothetical protein ACK41W_07670, partial [Cyanobacteriota bacterium]
MRLVRDAVSRSQLWGRGLAACLLAVPLGWLASGSAPLRAAPSEAEEEANCARVNQFVEANAAPALEALDRLARQRYGRGFTELTPEQVEVVARGSTVSGRQMTADFYTLLGEPSDSEPRRDVIAARDRRLPTPGCASLPVPNAAPLSVEPRAT